MNKKIIIIGAGGHASVLAEALYSLNYEIYAVVSPDEPKNRQLFANVLHLQSDVELTLLSPDSYILVNGIGSMPGSNLRAAIAAKFRALGFEFMRVVAASAIVSRSCVLGEGVQILTGAIVQLGCTLGDDVIINTAGIVEHDCKIGDGTHIAPGAVLSGEVKIGKQVHIGTNATVIQGVTVADFCIIGAGVTINKSVESAAIIYPAKPYIRSFENGD